MKSFYEWNIFERNEKFLFFFWWLFFTFFSLHSLFLSDFSLSISFSLPFQYFLSLYSLSVFLFPSLVLFSYFLALLTSLVSPISSHISLSLSLLNHIEINRRKYTRLIYKTLHSSWRYFTLVENSLFINLTLVNSKSLWCVFFIYICNVSTF